MTDAAYIPSPQRYDHMMYRRCGRSGVMIPVLTLGFWQNFGSDKSIEDIKALVHLAFDGGICHFDLANNYGPEYGAAEENFGRLMSDSLSLYRDELFISTKSGYDMWPGPYGNWGSRKYLMASLDQSLKRMNLDYVDIFYHHRWDPETPLEETMQALVDIVRQGKALYVGLSRYPLEKVQEAYQYLAARDVPCLLYQDRYNLIDRAPEQKGLIDLSVKAGAGFISFSPLQQGLLTNRYLNGIPADSRMARNRSLREEVLTPEMQKMLRDLDALAASRGQSLAQMALAWLLRDTRVTSVIIGASSVNQLEENIRALDGSDFSPEELQQIEALVH